MFRHILNFLRTGSLVLPTDFSETALLIEEARYYDIPSLNRALQEYPAVSNGSSLKQNGSPVNPKRARLEKARLEEPKEDSYQCLSLSISPDLGK